MHDEEIKIIQNILQESQQRASIKYHFTESVSNLPTNTYKRLFVRDIKSVSNYFNNCEKLLLLGFAYLNKTLEGANSTSSLASGGSLMQRIIFDYTLSKKHKTTINKIINNYIYGELLEFSVNMIPNMLIGSAINRTLSSIKDKKMYLFLHSLNVIWANAYTMERIEYFASKTDPLFENEMINRAIMANAKNAFVNLSRKYTRVNDDLIDVYSLGWC